MWDDIFKHFRKILNKIGEDEKDLVEDLIDSMEDGKDYYIIIREPRPVIPPKILPSKNTFDQLKQIADKNVSFEFTNPEYEDINEFVIDQIFEENCLKVYLEIPQIEEESLSLKIENKKLFIKAPTLKREIMIGLKEKPLNYKIEESTLRNGILEIIIH